METLSKTGAFQQALNCAGFSQTKCAKILGITPQAWYLRTKDGYGKVKVREVIRIANEMDDVSRALLTIALKTCCHEVGDVYEMTLDDYFAAIVDDMSVFDYDMKPCS